MPSGKSLTATARDELSGDFGICYNSAAPARFQIDHPAMCRVVLSIALYFISSATLFAVEPVDFVRDIQPILAANCFECHGPQQQEGQLRLDSKATFHAGGVGGTLLKQEEGSLLIERLTSSDEDQRMPQGADPLSDKQIKLISRWIDQGAPWPDNVGSDARPPATHWSYIAPQRHDPPQVGHSNWTQNPIDQFVLARLTAANLKPSPTADPAVLLRRVYLDLTGLPPSIAEVETFTADPSSEALEKVIDRLLDSPQFGEKWARQWLDLARYSDSNGYQADQLRDMWAYRDWVIQALNDDMPYDQFTIEQIAGDLIPAASESQRIATGFHRTPTCNVEAGVDPEENRTNQVIDRVNTTSTVWLGTTLECAQCHNHKYDPFSQKDYYRLFAYFNNTPLEVKNIKDVQFDFYGPKMELNIPSDRARQLDEVRSELAKQTAILERAVNRARLYQREWEARLALNAPDPHEQNKNADIPEKIIRLARKPPRKRTEGEQSRLDERFLQSRPEVIRLRQENGELKSRYEKLQPATTLVMVEMDEPRATKIFRRGQFLDPMDEVEPGVPDFMNPQTSPPNRMGLARWLVDSKNPLVSRVRVNHLWTNLFGRGLVRTGGDFGTQGEPPSHPKLLDWLAVEFVESGWSTKQMLKLIMTSATYQQSSRCSTAAQKADPNNILLARGPRFRMSAEMIRDNCLKISGLLNPQMGGPPVYPPQPPGLWRQTGRNEPRYKVATDENRFRRGIYVIWRRVAPYPSFVNFDAPDRTRCVVDRPRTNTPIQALTMMNDQAYVEMARAFAARVLREVPSKDYHKQIDYAFRTCVSRKPTAEEAATLERILIDEWGRFERDPDSAKKILGDVVVGDNVPKDSSLWAAWFCVANILLNLDETISKE